MLACGHPQVVPFVFRERGSTMGEYAGVIVDIKASAVDRIFYYRIPADLLALEIGHRVLVPFGTRKIEGYVLETTDTISIPESKIKSILRLLDSKPVLSKEQIAVAKWMTQYYIGGLSQALQSFLPIGSRYGKERVGAKHRLMVSLTTTCTQEWIHKLPKNAPKQRQVIELLMSKESILASDVCTQTGASYSTLATLRDKGYIRMEMEHILRNPELETEGKSNLTLNSEQANAYQAIQSEMSGVGTPILLHGVTGSGKTEVYLRAIADCLEKGQQALMLVPEIALTTQTIARFTQRFPGCVAVIHSALSAGERYDQWHRIYNGELPIVIGARSAIFAPVHNPGVMILDEEHETTYKQEEGTLKYHAREVALELGKQYGAVVVLGSATPSLESYHHAVRGDYRLVELTKRVADRPLPEICLVDMRQEFQNGNRSMFSQELTKQLNQTLERNEQAIIFLNRRGFASFLLCRDCGYVVECTNCQVSLTYHQTDERLHCHYCNAMERVPTSCPKCASKYLRQFGSGTQQVEEYVRLCFPQAKPVRFDTDTTTRKGSHQALLAEFRSKRANVLIGTQMIAKGLDFPGITLVGVLSADLSLNFPDFRAAERTFHLLTQVGGRAGRDIKQGRVIIQCYDPTHYALQAVKNNDYLGMYRQEITFRRQLEYPPFGHLIRILIQGSEHESETYAREVYRYLREQLPTTEVYGAVPAPVARIKGRFRWHILIKTVDGIHSVLWTIPQPKNRVSVSIDVEPQFFL